MYRDWNICWLEFGQPLKQLGKKNFLFPSQYFLKECLNISMKKEERCYVAENVAKSLQKILVMGSLEGGERPLKDLFVFDMEETDFIYFRPCLWVWRNFLLLFLITNPITFRFETIVLTLIYLFSLAGDWLGF